MTMQDTKADMQELFDGIVNTPCALMCLISDLDDVHTKYLDVMKSEGYTKEVYDGFADVAKRYGLDYKHPMFSKPLTLVKTTEPHTVH